MKNYLIAFSILAVSLYACSTQQSSIARSDVKNHSAKNDTVRIANDSLEYEVIIIDPGFNSWMLTNARDRGFHSQKYLESRNIVWVNEWNLRVGQPRYSPGLYEMRIDYRQGIDYGYEVNYMLFNYLTYFQIKNNQRLGGFVPRI